MLSAWSTPYAFRLLPVLLMLALPRLTGTTQCAASETRKPANPPAGVLTVMAVGDVMLGSSFPDWSGLPPDDTNLLAAFTPILSRADVVFGNLEGPILDGGSTTKCSTSASLSGRCFAFRVPPDYARLLKQAGFTVFNLANNHSSDFGEKGRASTRRTLDRLGINHFGADRDTYSTAVIQAAGKSIGLIGFAPGGVSPDINDIDAAEHLVRQLKRKVDLVIVSFHGGGEGNDRQHVPFGTEVYLGEARGNLREFTHRVVDAGADLVLGHGPHVLRGMEIYKQHLIVYSMGNFCTYGSFSLHGATALTAAYEIRLDARGRLLDGRIYAGRQFGRGGPLPDPEGVAVQAVRQLSVEDFGQSAVLPTLDGTFKPPNTAGKTDSSPDLLDSDRQNKRDRLGPTHTISPAVADDLMRIEAVKQTRSGAAKVSFPLHGATSYESAFIGTSSPSGLIANMNGELTTSGRVAGVSQEMRILKIGGETPNPWGGPLIPD